MLVSIRSALLTNIKFDEGWSIVKIRLQKVRLNFHRRNGPRCFERVGVVLVAPATPHNTVAKKRILSLVIPGIIYCMIQ